jgi:hypothetical protein
MRFAKYVQHIYVEGRPRHIASPDTSHIAVMESTAYEAMTTSEVQTLLRHKHVLVTGLPQTKVSFDAKGLRTLANLDAPIDLQGEHGIFHLFIVVFFTYLEYSILLDQSIPVTDSDYRSQVCTGNLRQMLDASRTPTSPILNALSFPQPLSGIQSSTMSSEIEAWQVTEGKPFCGRNLAFPTGTMRWGLAATEGARHWIHIDSDGLGTFVDVLCGGKWWILFCPPKGKSKTAFGSIDIFLNGFETDAPGPWVAEAVYLAPGTRL